MATKATTKKTATTPRKSATAPAPSPLRSAALPRKDLVDIGARYALTSLTTHASAVLSKVEAQNADTEATTHFADYGLDATWVSAVQESSSRKGCRRAKGQAT